MTDNGDVNDCILIFICGCFWRVIFCSDIVDEGVESFDHIFGGSVSSNFNIRLSLSLFFFNLLSTWTSLSPNIPRPLASLLPEILDLFTRQALVLPVIPFADVICHLHRRFRPDWQAGLCWIAFLLPRIFIPAAER